MDSSRSNSSTDGTYPQATTLFTPLEAQGRHFEAQNRSRDILSRGTARWNPSQRKAKKKKKKFVPISLVPTWIWNPILPQFIFLSRSSIISTAHIAAYSDCLSPRWLSRENRDVLDPTNRPSLLAVRAVSLHSLRNGVPVHRPNFGRMPVAQAPALLGLLPGLLFHDDRASILVFCASAAATTDRPWRSALRTHNPRPALPEAFKSLRSIYRLHPSHHFVLSTGGRVLGSREALTNFFFFSAASVFVGRKKKI